MASLSRAVRHLRDYVAIPSVNPMGGEGQPAEIVGERRLAEHLREQLRGLGLDAELLGAGPRSSVVATAEAAPGAETLLVASHLDTVPVDGMTIPPFEPTLADERLYGRGSCDTKGGMAALVAALERVLARGTLRRNLIVVGESDEEFGSRGVRDVLDWLGGRRPDLALVTEPTSLRAVTAHKGIAHARLVARGRACHSSNPRLGSNAIVALSRVVVALDALAEEIADKRDPRLGEATLSVGLFEGGRAPNVVPDEAWLLLDRRLLPGEDESEVRRELRRALETAGEVERVSIASCQVMKAPLGTSDDAPVVLTCQAVLRAHGHDPSPASVAFGTDAGIFGTEGIASVVIGPGSIDQAHTADEWVPVAELDAMTELFAAWLEGKGA